MPKVAEFPQELLSTIVEVAQLAWQDEGLCREIGLDSFFPNPGGDGGRAALAVCSRCPVQAECLEYAVTQPVPPDGIWGGATQRRIKAIRRVRGITEPSREDEE